MPIPEQFKSKQGAHLDPLDPSVPKPDPSTWSDRERRAHSSPAMTAYRRALSLPNVPDVRQAVLDDLSSFYGFSREECLKRCINWEQWSVEEWQRKDRGTSEGLFDFYQTMQSWSFDLLWYSYLQAESYCYPVSVAIADSIPPTDGGVRRHLDFGSGIGATAQVFRALGYETHLADISKPLLAFAKFRLDRRGVDARYIYLGESSIPEGEYDVITAIDTLAHVPDVPKAAALLHAALKPGGLLFANIDARKPSPESAWHLYADDLLPRFHIQIAGFEPLETFDGMITKYRRVPSRGVAHAVREARDYVLLRSPLRPSYRFLRRVASAVKHRASSALHITGV
jgi:SAM-dependent methyltransferase